MHLSEVTTALPRLEAASLHLSEVTTALPLLEAASLHLYSLARLMLFAFFVSKGSLFRSLWAR